MSATGIAYVHDMHRLSIPPFGRHPCARLSSLDCDIRHAALVEDAQALAAHIRTTRLERLWRIENWLTFRKQHHPRITEWLHAQLVEVGWRRAKP